MKLERWPKTKIKPCRSHFWLMTYSRTSRPWNGLGIIPTGCRNSWKLRQFNLNHLGNDFHSNSIRKKDWTQIDKVQFFSIFCFGRKSKINSRKHAFIVHSMRSEVSDIPWFLDIWKNLIFEALWLVRLTIEAELSIDSCFVGMAFVCELSEDRCFHIRWLNSGFQIFFNVH